MSRHWLSVLVAGMAVVGFSWGQNHPSNATQGSKAPDGTSANKKVAATIEVQGTGVVRVPADGVRILVTLHLRMPTVKETAAEEERRATKLEQAWQALKPGTVKVRLLDQHLQAVRQLDVNNPGADIHELPVVGYSAWRLYQVEVTELPAEQLQEAARQVQKIALQEGAIPGLLGPPTPWGIVGGPVNPIPEVGGTPMVSYFLSRPEAAYSQALKKAKENALAKVAALHGDQAPARVMVQEVNPPPAPADANPPGVFPAALVGVLGTTDRFLSRTPQVEVVAWVRVVCEY